MSKPLFGREGAGILQSNNYSSYQLNGKYQATSFTANEISGTLYWTPLGTPNGVFA